jgi:hypothetical protein
VIKRLAVLPLFLLALVACSDDDDGDKAASTTTSTTETTTSSSSSTTSTTEAVVEEGEPSTVALDWVQAIAAGEDDEAIALTSPRSLAAIGGEDGWHDMEIELAEGWGAWGNTDDVEVVTDDVTDGVWTATFHGSVAQEGPPEESWSTLVVVVTDDGLRVEPFLDLGNVELDPESGASIEPTHTFSAFVLGGREVALLVDGALVDATIESADGDQQHASASHTMDPGLHGFAVVVWNDTGVMARSAVYTVPND